MNTIKLCLALLVVLFISCYRSLFEKAEIKKGTSVGFGVGVVTCDAITYSTYDIMEWLFDYSLIGTGTLFIHHGYSKKIAWFGQVSAGTGVWFTKKGYYPHRSKIFDIQTGLKIKVGQHGAIRTGLGFPGICDLTYLYDYNPVLTQNISIGVNGAGLGLIIHPKLSDKHIGHISINCSQSWAPPPLGNKYRPSLFLGFGIE